MAKRKSTSRRKSGKVGKASKRYGRCPSSWRGHPVKRAKNGACYIRQANGRARFVPKKK